MRRGHSSCAFVGRFDNVTWGAERLQPPSTPSVTPYSSRRRRPWCTIPGQLAIIASSCFISPQTAFST